MTKIFVLLCDHGNFIEGLLDGSRITVERDRVQKWQRMVCWQVSRDTADHLRFGMILPLCLGIPEPICWGAVSYRAHWVWIAFSGGEISHQNLRNVLIGLIQIVVRWKSWSLELRYNVFLPKKICERLLAPGLLLHFLNFFNELV